jgi:hypothetical protein
MSRGVSTSLPTKLPKRFKRGVIWKLDRRCKVVREVAGGLMALWQDLGGYESLSHQERLLSERVAFIHYRVLAFESAVLSGKEPPFDAGVYSNLANVLMGHLKTLGLNRRASRTNSLQAFLAKGEAA